MLIRILYGIGSIISFFIMLITAVPCGIIWLFTGKSYWLWFILLMDKLDEWYKNKSM